MKELGKSLWSKLGMQFEGSNGGTYGINWEGIKQKL